MLSFKDIIGHGDIINHFKLSIKNNKISHAYLLTGEDDSGKRVLADAYAMALQCIDLNPKASDIKDIDSCRTCKSCKQALSNNHPDIISIVREKASIGVDDIRNQVNKDIQIKPYSSPYKIYIIDEAEKLTEQGQNALLKTIEEPPDYAIIILLTNNINNILQTIQSRCVVLQLKPVSKDSIQNYLMKEHEVPDYQAELSAVFAQGNVGKAIKYSSSEEFINIKNNTIHLLQQINNMENYEVVDFVKKLGKDKDDIINILDLILLWYRDVLMYKVTKDPNLLLYKQEIMAISKHAKLISYEGIQNIIKEIDKAKARINANVNLETTLLLMLFTIKENSND